MKDNVIQLFARREISRAAAIEAFNKTDMWFFIEASSELLVDVELNKNVAIFLPAGQQLPSWINPELVGHIYYGKASQP